MSVPFRPLGNRVVIKADVEAHAPEETASGLVLAKTLAAAVEGSDAEDSWFVGTVVALGPLVGEFNIRPYVLRELQAEFDGDACMGRTELARLMDAIRRLPVDCRDPLHIGDRVTFSWQSGQQITIDGEKYLIMAATEVLAVLEPDHA